MNYGFVPEGRAPLELRPEDEPDRAFIGLYELAVTGIDTHGKTILEVGSGRGGGARYLARYHKPSEVTGLDFSTSAVRFANQHSRDWPNLKFVEGDAAALPFPNDSFDIVVNIESSHCYPDVAAFTREVSRVLKPEGIFSFRGYEIAGDDLSARPRLGRRESGHGRQLRYFWLVYCVDWIWLKSGKFKDYNLSKS